jgi:NAD(P)-dependent dehydrogenase (short-subunit alcohol dehydrogenase family)
MSELTVVVGAGSIGQAIARRMSAGKHVLLADLNQSNVEFAAAVLHDAGFEVSTTTVDVSSRESVQALVETTQAWSPIGGITFYRDSGHTSTLDDPVVCAIADAHARTPAQVLLRWGLQHGRSVIPKSTKPSRIAENLDVFEFDLSADDMTAIDGLETGHRGGPEPEVVTLETFGRPIPEAAEA